MRYYVRKNYEKWIVEHRKAKPQQHLRYISSSDVQLKYIAVCDRPVVAHMKLSKVMTNLLLFALFSSTSQFV